MALQPSDIWLPYNFMTGMQYQNYCTYSFYIMYLNYGFSLRVFYHSSLSQIYMTAYGNIISKRYHHHRFIIYLPRTSSSCTLFETALSQSIA